MKGRKSGWVRFNYLTLILNMWREKNIVVADSLSIRPSISLMDVAENCKATLEVEYAKDIFSCEFFYGNNHDDRNKVF